MPVTDEKAPKEHDFAVLVRRLWDLPSGAAAVFNCQACFSLLVPPAVQMRLGTLVMMPGAIDVFSF